MEVTWNPGTFAEQKYSIGQIMLDEEDLTMEYCGTVEKPMDEEETETTEQGA